MLIDQLQAGATLAMTGPQIASLVFLGLCCVVVFYLKIKGNLPSDPGGSI